MGWYFFWVIHPAVFLPTAFLFPLTFLKIEGINKAYLATCNFVWYAMPILYPILIGMFAFSTSPYWIMTELE